MGIDPRLLPKEYRDQIASAKAMAPRPRTAVPEPHVEPHALATPTVQEKGSGRRLLRITAYRTRLLDPDNLVPKWEIDALRYANVLAGDTPDHIEILTKQIKVKTKAEEGTEIVITEI